MSNTLRRFGFLASLMTTQIVLGGNLHAGNSSAGGGVISKYANNPWFLNANTTKIKYCIKSDIFPYSDAELDHFVQKGFAFWQAQIAGGDSQARIGAQTFVASCDGDVDIQFQFGFLTPEQKQAIPDYRDFLSFANRTAYDKVTLRGKGYIYVAPETGPDRPDADYILPNQWTFCQGCVLEESIKHELGHVFGVPHYGDKFDLMGESHLEWLATIGTLDPKFKFETPGVLLNMNGNFASDCGFDPGYFFGPHGRYSCIYLTADSTNSGPVHILVEEGDQNSSTRKTLGYIEWRTGFSQGFTASQIRLPPEQKVFGGVDREIAALSGTRGQMEMGLFAPSDANSIPMPMIVNLNILHGEINITGIPKDSSYPSVLFFTHVILK